MLIDYHSHVNFNVFKDDSDAVLGRALLADVGTILVGTQIDTSKRAVEMAEKFPNGVYAAIGLHPVHLEEQIVDEEEIHFKTREENFDPINYHALAHSKKVVAIGEIGLDYFHLGSEESIPKQKQVFRAQLDLAHELNLPVILHCRTHKGSIDDAYEDLLAIISEYLGAGKLKQRGVAHCFLGSQKIAKQFIQLGFAIGFTGIVTFKNAPENQALARVIPLESILVETDAPYLTPVPHRGKRNEPLYVKFVAQKIAELKGLSIGIVEKALEENTLRIFTKISAQ